MATCKVFGYIIDGNDNPVEGMLVQFIPASLPAINSSTGKAVWSYPIQTVTSSTGYFEENLLCNTNFVVIIQQLGLKEKIRIPDLVEKNLFELTGMYVSGDPTPGDDSGTETNW